MSLQVSDMIGKNITGEAKDVENEEDLQWANADNNVFYEHVKASGLAELAKKAGLESCCDLQILLPLINNATSILEVGAGYGRVIEFLLANNYRGEITAIERSASLYEHLKSHYKSNAALLNIDIFQSNKIPARFDLILSMWLGIADFCRDEQPKIISILKKLLAPGGKLVIDTMPDETKLLQSKQIDKKTFLLCVNGSSVYIRKPHDEDIRSYANQAGFSQVERRHYLTTTNRERVLYVLS